MFESATRFPFVSVLEQNWESIRSEFSALRDSELLEWPETNLYNQGWKVFGLYAFGKRLDDHCAACPETAALVEAIPGMTTAGFSRMAPGTEIRPHEGYTHEVLRCHLGLVIPSDCGLRVGEETRTWEPGRCLVFDDTTEHEAWNRSGESRVILLVDFLKDPRSSLRFQPPAGLKI